MTTTVSVEAVTESKTPFDLSIQSNLLNVSHLDRSVSFYSQVLGFAVVSNTNGLATLKVAEADRCQVLLLRQVSSRARRSGGWGIGMRVLGFEVGTSEELHEVEGKLDEHHAIIGRRKGGTWQAIVAVDPDRTILTVGLGASGKPMTVKDWEVLDDFIYALGM